ncbi:hypothetical protein SUDANB95_02658 [Actinosynnema sp. ALI-1.44]
MASKSGNAPQKDQARDGHRPRIWVVLAGTTGLLCFDVLVVWLLHIGGAALSQLVDVLAGSAEDNRLTTALREHGIDAFRPEYLGGPLPLDLTTAVYMALTAVVAVVFVVTDRGDRLPRAWATTGVWLPMAPAVLYPLVAGAWMALDVAAGLVSLVARPFTEGPDAWTVPDAPVPLTWGVFLIFPGYAYGMATIFSIGAQAVLLDLWKPRPVTGSA